MGRAGAGVPDISATEKKNNIQRNFSVSDIHLKANNLERHGVNTRKRKFIQPLYIFASISKAGRIDTLLSIFVTFDLKD